MKRDIQARGGLPEDWKRVTQGMILGIVDIAVYVLLTANIA